MKNIFSSLLIIFSSISQIVTAQESNITISDSADYYDTKIIPLNIRQECTELGRQFSDSTEAQLVKSGWVVNRNNELSQSGLSVKLLITNALSAGNAWIGHKKSVTIEATLLKDGEVVDTYEAVRNSGGGFAGGIKSSCDVLKRCVDTLGKDVSKWLARTL